MQAGVMTIILLLDLQRLIYWMLLKTQENGFRI
jgi:hypothetical protein